MLEFLVAKIRLWNPVGSYFVFVARLSRRALDSLKFENWKLSWLECSVSMYSVAEFVFWRGVEEGGGGSYVICTWCAYIYICIIYVPTSIF